MDKRLIFIVVIVFVLISCGQQQDSSNSFNYELNVIWSEVDTEKLKTGDTIHVFAEFDFNKHISQTLIINVPSNVVFKAYSDDNKLIAEKPYAGIYNLKYKEATKDHIPLIPYNTKHNFSIPINQFSKNKIKFEVYKTVLKKDQKDLGIKLYYVSNKKEDENMDFDLSYKSQSIFKESQLPIIKINTRENLTDEFKVLAEFQVIDNDGVINKFADTATTKGIAKIKIRGSSSKLLPKRSYLFKTYDDSLRKKSLIMLGLPEEKEWVLYAPFIDYSLMRNVLGYRLHREIGNYSPRTKYFHLIINNDYRGIYVLTERIKRGKNRIDLAKLNKGTTSKDSISGGYIIKLDKGKGEVWKSPYLSKIDSGYGKWFFYVYPKSKNINQTQRDYIKGYVSDFETALLKGSNWQDYIDMRTFIDYMIMMEVTKNVDAYRLSTFYTKDRGGKLRADPLWDLNLTFGLTSYYDGYKTEGLMFRDEATPFWWQYFLKDKEFKAMFKKRWKELRKTTLSEAFINQCIDEEYVILKSDIHYNTEKWLSYQESNDWRKDNQKSFEESVNYLKAWSKRRNSYLDKVFSEL